MAKGKKSFLLYTDQKEIFKSLTLIQRGELMTLIYDYVDDESPGPSKDPMVDLVFKMYRQTLKRDLEKWDNTLLARSKAGKASAEARRLKRKQNSTNSTHVKSVEQNSTNSTDSVNVSDSVSVNDNVIVTDNETVINTKSDIGVETPGNSKISLKEERGKESLSPGATQKKELMNQAIDQIITFLNEKSGRGFGIETESYRTLIRARLNDGLKVHDLKDMIIFKCTEWFGTDMEKYLRPETLFQKSKCQGYVDTMLDYKRNSNNGAFKEIKGKAIEDNTEQILAAIEKQLER